MTHLPPTYEADVDFWDPKTALPFKGKIRFMLPHELLDFIVPWGLEKSFCEMPEDRTGMYELVQRTVTKL
eukprot:1493893-Pyramimonas_sp.AAC.1